MADVSGAAPLATLNLGNLLKRRGQLDLGAASYSREIADCEHSAVGGEGAGFGRRVANGRQLLVAAELPEVAPFEAAIILFPGLGSLTIEALLRLFFPTGCRRRIQGGVGANTGRKPMLRLL